MLKLCIDARRTVQIPVKETKEATSVTSTEIFPVFVEEKGRVRPQPLYYCKRFPNAEGVSIGVRRRWWEFWFPRLRVPARLRDAVTRILREYHGEGNEDCSCFTFAALAAGGELFFSRWNHMPLANVQPGDVVFLITPQEVGHTFHHAAAYLGKGLYISVYGMGNDLEVSTLEEMCRLYGATEVVKVTPIRSQ